MHQRQTGAIGSKPAYQPSDVQYGNKPVLSSTGSRWLVGDAVTAIVAPVTLMIVGHANAMSSFISAGAAAEPVNLVWRKNSTGTSPVEFYSKFPGFSAVAVTGPSDGLVGSPCVIMLTDTGSSTSIYVNDLTTPKVTTASNRWGSTTAMNLMMTAAGVTQLNGKIAEAAIWRDVVPAGADRAGLAAYLVDRYGGAVPATA